MKFISSITMSAAEAHGQAGERDAALAAEAAAGEGRGRVASWGSSTRRMSSTSWIPPIAENAPPAPPSAGPASPRSVEVEVTMQRAEHEARVSEKRAGSGEERVAERIPRTKAAGKPVGGAPHPAPPEPTDAAFSNVGAVLPVVEEAAEGTSSGGRSRRSFAPSQGSVADGRPCTPVKNGPAGTQAGINKAVLGRQTPGNMGPPTPPKSGYDHRHHVKLDSTDSGYGVSGHGMMINGLHGLCGSQRSSKIRPQVSRDSLDKALPPLPAEEAPVRRVS